MWFGGVPSAGATVLRAHAGQSGMHAEGFLTLRHVSRGYHWNLGDLRRLARMHIALRLLPRLGAHGRSPR